MSSTQLLKNQLSQSVGRLRPGALHAPRRFVGACGLRHAVALPALKSVPHSLQRINERTVQEPVEVEVLPARSHTAPSPLSKALSSGGLLASATAVALAASLALGLPADAAAPAADTAALSIPGIVGDSPLREGFVSGFLLIFFSEIGDKTFFIALLLALKQPKGLVFTGTFGALAVMTVVSVLLGQCAVGGLQVLHQVDELVPENGAGLPYDDLLAAALLLYFGFKTLQDAKDAGESAAEEKEEAQEVVDGLKSSSEDTLKLILTTFTLVFAAEWGDKSFLATIALAAASSPLGVTAGAVAGHGVATGLAVAGGGFLSRYFSEQVLQYIGGSLFLVFAAATIVDLFV
ncbi:hypothetical protein HYH02_008291 [Chlamydomonas schloesseri]|uniref:GDT1 family protein n=1 Tax=Chlamydomonas schloesseri TaxID=2026947 RepID=A0A835WGT1_9CHLO|nr:hypothetical protein HYH02_008291 [Chlamydomonas schloesseri]|eukprot:KAG2446730.1 hypothetical protein HYH02_008291 [Chlamydomonas schloesseri]